MRCPRCYGPMTVSYTHLDVYKRQVLFWAAHNLFTVATVCFGGAMLTVMLYTYLHDYVLVTKGR